MNVSYSDSITSTIKSLRENVYSKDEFKNTFSKNLENDIGATDIDFIPDQFGGWSVNVSTEKDSSTRDSSSYISSITDTLMNSIKEVSKSSMDKDIACNLANVIVTGNDSIVVKL